MTPIERFYQMSPEELDEAISKFVEREQRREEIKNVQIDRFYNKILNKTIIFSELIEKIEKKYNSKEYKDKWFNLGYEPPEDLLFFIFDFISKYGRKANESEILKYSNDFTTDLLVYDGYIFNQMDGQGTIIIVSKLQES